MRVRRTSTRWPIAAACVCAILLGAACAWAERHTINLDGISYLEVGEAYSRGDWRMAINGYWSPLFSWLLGLAMLLLRPSPSSEFAVAHLVTFGIYVGTLAAFSFLLHEAILVARGDAAELSGSGSMRLPEWAWIGLGSALFLWSSLWFVGLGIQPDQLVSAILYVAGGLLLRMRRYPERWRLVILLGALLGVGYLAKAVMFPLAFAFLAVAPSPPRLRAKMWRTVAGILAFLVVSAPFVAALSLSKGRLTFGDTGTLNYAWYVNEVPRPHWQGEPAGSGVPKHPERKVFEAPAIYEFGAPIGGSYPPWSDPSYWDDGLAARFNLRQQMRVVVTHLRTYLDYFVFADVGSVTVCVVILFLVGRDPRAIVRDIGRQRALWLPALAALGVYGLVYIERRHVGGFILLFWMGMLGAVRIPDSAESRRLVAAVTLVVLTIAGVRVTLLTFQQIVAERSWTTHSQSLLADDLRTLGFSQNAAVACIGGACWNHEWARLARVRIVAEIPPKDDGSASIDEQQFWAADPNLRTRIMTALERTGARALVASPPPNVLLNAWQRLGDSGSYVHFLPGVQSQ